MNKNHTSVSLTHIFYLLLFLIAGCGDIKTSSHFDQPQVKLSEYAGLEITDFETEIENVPKEALTEIPDETAGLLASKKTGFQKIERGQVEGIPEENTLVLLGEVTDYESGRDIKYEGGAVKFGESSFTVQLALVEKSTGKEVATGEVNGFSSLGFIKTGIYKGLAEEIAKFISENY